MHEMYIIIYVKQYIYVYVRAIVYYFYLRIENSDQAYLIYVKNTSLLIGGNDRYNVIFILQ